MDRRRRSAAVLCCAVLCILLISCTKDKGKSGEEIVKTSIFSWEEEYILPENETQVSRVMEQLVCSAVYQQIPMDTDEETVKAYLKRRGDKGQDVYYLTGAPEWGTEKNAESMLEQVKRVSRLNQAAGEDGRFTGIVWDVEPYLLDEWDENAAQVMKQYINNCKTAYQAALEKELRVIVCIPYFYDNKGFEAELGDLAENACDALAVMNYNKEDEAGQIRTETELARTYGKGIIHIAELQKPGYHELTENNTYYYDGIEGVRESFSRLKEDLEYSGLGFSWHYMRPALKLLGGEESS